MATVTSAQQTAITNLYIGLFNRAPDAAGLEFWAQALANGASLNTITGGFIASLESQTIYTPAQTADQFVSTFYQTVFGRAPDAAGLAFWTGVLNAAGGTSSAAAKALLVSKIVDIISTPLTVKPAGLSDAEYAQTVSDRSAFSKKVAIGIDFAVVQKSNDLTAAKQVIYPETTPGIVDQVIALTIADETKAGGAGKDTFNAPLDAGVQTLNNDDILDGGAGIDTLNAELKTSSFVTPTLTNIEIVNVKVVSSNGGLSLFKATGVTNAGFDGSTADGSLYNVGAAALSVSNQTATATFAGATSAALSLSLSKVGTSIASTTVNVNDNLSTTHALVASDAFVSFGGNAGVGVGTVTVDATGTNKLALSASNAGTVTSMSVTGTGSVDFSAQALSALTSFTDTGSGNITLTTTTTTVGAVNIATGDGADTIVANGASIKSLSTGAGIDTVTLNTAGLSASASVNLGAGNDTITLAFGSVAGAVVNGGDGDDTINTGAVTHTRAAAGPTDEVQTLTLGASSGTPAGTDRVSVSFVSVNVVTAPVDITDKAAVATAIKTAFDAQNFIGVSTTAGADTVTFSFFGGRAASDESAITFNGNQDGGAGILAGTVVETIKGGAATSSVVGTLDTLTGGNGADTFTFGTADVNTTAGAPTAVITDFATGTDKIRLLNSGYFAGSGTTVVKAVAVAADIATMLTAADTALAGVVKYYIGQVGADSYVVTDLDGVGYTNVIKLENVTLAGIVETDILGATLPV
jgi:Ca2+-binding RTX toxin-like protein